MAFFSDFIEAVVAEAQAHGARVMHNEHGEPQLAIEKSLMSGLTSISPFLTVAAIMRQSKIVKFSAEQSQVFLDTPTVEGQDYLQWLRLPFPSVYIHHEGDVLFHDYATSIEADIDAARARGDEPEAERLSVLKFQSSPAVKGVVLAEMGVERWGNQDAWDAMRFETPTLRSEVERVIAASFLMPIKGFYLNMDTLTVLVRKDNRIVISAREHQSARVKMRRWIIHVVNFLSSPSVKLVGVQPDKALQKARVKRGKEPLPGWYEILWRHEIKEYSRNKISPKAWSHSYRYTVRGHPKIFKKGRMAGRVVWCPSHMRGLKNELYKPAVRVIPP